MKTIRFIVIKKSVIKKVESSFMKVYRTCVSSTKETLHNLPFRALWLIALEARFVPHRPLRLAEVYLEEKPNELFQLNHQLWELTEPVIHQLRILGKNPIEYIQQEQIEYDELLQAGGYIIATLKTIDSWNPHLLTSVINEQGQREEFQFQQLVKYLEDQPNSLLWQKGWDGWKPWKTSPILSSLMEQKTQRPILNPTFCVGLFVQYDPVKDVLDPHLKKEEVGQIVKIDQINEIDLSFKRSPGFKSAHFIFGYEGMYSTRYRIS